MERIKKNKVKKFKVTGGAAAQILALYNILFYEQNNSKDLEIEVIHYEGGTGGYFPLAISDLLYGAEYKFKVVPSKGSINGVLKIGEIIESHQLFQSGMNREKSFEIIRKLGIESQLKALKREWTLRYQFNRLRKVPGWANTISGGYMPFIDGNSRWKLDKLFREAGIDSIFPETKTASMFKDSAVIHYRLGNKRTAFSHPELGGKVNSILNAKVFANILENLEKIPQEIFVVSDEISVAQELLREVGISAQVNPLGKGLWSDLALMNAAGLLLCPWSTVSMLAIACSADSSKKIFFPEVDGSGSRRLWEVEHVDYYKPEYLPDSHWIYGSEVTHSELAEEDYFNNRK